VARHEGGAKRFGKTEVACAVGWVGDRQPAQAAVSLRRLQGRHATDSGVQVFSSGVQAVLH